MAAQTALDAASTRGTLVAAATVFAELIAAPGRSETLVRSFFEKTGSADTRVQELRSGHVTRPLKFSDRRANQRRILSDAESFQRAALPLHHTFPAHPRRVRRTEGLCAVFELPR
jgi:hypothetical protein